MARIYQYAVDCHHLNTVYCMLQQKSGEGTTNDLISIDWTNTLNTRKQGSV